MKAREQLDKQAEIKIKIKINCGCLDETWGVIQKTEGNHAKGMIFLATVNITLNTSNDPGLSASV
jgi:hypothetical protein